MPPDIHEAIVEKHLRRIPATGAHEPDPALYALAGAMRQCRAASEQIIAVIEAVMADESLTLAARGTKVRGTVVKLAERATQGLDAARTKPLIRSLIGCNEQLAPSLTGGRRYDRLILFPR